VLRRGVYIAAYWIWNNSECVD